MFLPNKWPAYFKKASGCIIWDLDENKLLDMSIMGIGTNTLGYGTLLLMKLYKNYPRRKFVYIKLSRRGIG